MKTKEISFTLPIIIFLLELALFGGEKNAKRLLSLLPFFLALFIIPAAFIFSGEGASIGDRVIELQKRELGELSRYNYLIAEFRVIVKYLRLLVVPMYQTLYYDMPVFDSFFNPEVFLSFLFLAVLFTGAAYFLMRSVKHGRPYGVMVSLGLVWFFITISVESSIIPIKDVIFEHRLYLPSVGPALAFTAAVFYGFKRAEGRVKRPLAAALVVLIAAVLSLGMLTYRRNGVWSDALMLWKDVAAKNPNSSMAHQNLGHYYYGAGMTEEAIRELKRAKELDPGFYLPRYNLGYIYQVLGRHDEAIEE